MIECQNKQTLREHTVQKRSRTQGKQQTQILKFVFFFDFSPKKCRNLEVIDVIINLKRGRETEEAKLKAPQPGSVARGTNVSATSTSTRAATRRTRETSEDGSNGEEGATEWKHRRDAGARISQRVKKRTSDEMGEVKP